LILDVRVGPNNIDDAALLVDAMPDLAERTDIEELYTDGGYGSDDADTTLNAYGVVQIQTGLRGNAPDPNMLSLSDFVIEQDDQGVPTHLTCPQGQRVAVERGRSTGFVARFDPGICADCPLQRQGRCRAAPQKRNPRFALHFTQAEVFRAKRRQHHRDYRRTPGNLRAAVEATVRSVKHPFRQGKLPVRGLFRVTCMVIASAAMVNVRRIHQYWTWLMQSGRFAHIFRAGKPSSRPSTPASALCTNTRRLHWSPLRRRRCRPHITCFSC
ncbi:MAG: transposase, partial [Caldilineaceae bacterium]|nr:transposase [Caldilineaceae bacterium]